MEVDLYCSDQVRPLKFQYLQCDYLKKVHNVLFIYLFRYVFLSLNHQNETKGRLLQLIHILKKA